MTNFFPFAVVFTIYRLSVSFFPSPICLQIPFIFPSVYLCNFLKRPTVTICAHSRTTTVEIQLRPEGEEGEAAGEEAAEVKQQQQPDPDAVQRNIKPRLSIAGETN